MRFAKYYLILNDVMRNLPERQKQGLINKRQ